MYSVSFQRLTLSGVGDMVAASPGMYTPEFKTTASCDCVCVSHVAIGHIVVYQTTSAPLISFSNCRLICNSMYWM